MTEKRQYSRVDSIFLITYVHLDKDGHQIMQGMGRTINVSESGIMLETHVALDTHAHMDVVVGLQEEMVTIRGKVIFSHPSDPARFQSGIEFLDIEYPSLQLLRRYIQAFKEKSVQEK